MSRKQARETVFKLIYERCITGEDNKLSFDLYTQNFSGDDLEYIKTVYQGVGKNSEFLNNIIQRYSKAFKLDRVFKIDLAALLIASYEMLFMDDIPQKISINEAVELSKKYSTEKSYRFVNGILSSVIKHNEELRSEINNY